MIFKIYWFPMDFDTKSQECLTRWYPDFPLSVRCTSSRTTFSFYPWMSRSSPRDKPTQHFYLFPNNDLPPLYICYEDLNLWPCTTYDAVQWHFVLSPSLRAFNSFSTRHSSSVWMSDNKKRNFHTLILKPLQVQLVWNFIFMIYLKFLHFSL